MDDNKKIRVAITHGDTNGIGYELIFKTFAEPEMLEFCTPIIYGSPKVATYHRKALNFTANFSIINDAREAQAGRVNILPVFDEEVKVDLGMPTQESSRAAIQALDKAVTDYKDGLFDVLVMGPVDKSNMHVDGFDFTNERFIEMCLGDGQKGLCLTLSGDQRMALVTDDVALRDVPAAITKENVTDKIKLFFNTLQRDFRIAVPRIAVLSLNSNDNDAHPGKEEEEAIVPAINDLAAQDINAFGPYQADEYFESGYFTHFDGTLAMYHDQGLAPFKALSPNNSVRYMAGLSLIATSPDEGPCYDIAGNGEADETSFRQAIYTAIDAFRNRANYEEPYEHPLPKLYHEKKDESEKVRFAIPKKRENNNKESQK
jgi:4-hydroxythreonine-4-phosphate dehydrogenase